MMDGSSLAGSNLGSVGQRSSWGVIKGDLRFTSYL